MVITMILIHRNNINTSTHTVQFRRPGLGEFRRPGIRFWSNDDEGKGHGGWLMKVINHVIKFQNKWAIFVMPLSCVWLIKWWTTWYKRLSDEKTFCLLLSLLFGTFMGWYGMLVDMFLFNLRPSPFLRPFCWFVFYYFIRIQWKKGFVFVFFCWNKFCLDWWVYFFFWIEHRYDIIHHKSSWNVYRLFYINDFFSCSLRDFKLTLNPVQDHRQHQGNETNNRYLNERMNYVNCVP